MSNIYLKMNNVIAGCKHIVKEKAKQAGIGAVGGVVGSAEIVHRWGDDVFLSNEETVWSMSFDEFKKL